MITTERLDLVPATVDTATASLEDVGRLGRLLRATVPKSWPPDLLDRAALEWTLRWIQGPTYAPDWTMYWVVLREPRTLVGVCGFKGAPADGTVELGYGIVTEFQRRRFATEATLGLVKHAFASRQVGRVIAETLPGLVPSIGVLERCGFTFIGDGSEAGVIRYERVRKQGQGAL